jgi:hypothetical protein
MSIPSAHDYGKADMRHNSATSSVPCCPSDELGIAHEAGILRSDTQSRHRWVSGTCVKVEAVSSVSDTVKSIYQVDVPLASRCSVLW